MSGPVEEPQQCSASGFNPPGGWNYEVSVGEIETLINQIETGDLDLTEVFEKFSSAVERLQQCEAFLHERRQQMDLIIERLGENSDN
jgi:exodeoxyribonuclease VII small subunit